MTATPASGDGMGVRLDHGVIGNGSLIALIREDSGIDWLCLPRFDSPSIFGRLLDEEKGGTWRFLADGKPLRGRMRYVRNTNVLLTRFEHEGAAWDLFDFAPRIPLGLREKTPLRLYRFLVPVSGRAKLSVQFDPRPDYGRVAPQLSPEDYGVEITGGDQTLTLFSNVPSPYIVNGAPFLLDRPRYFGLGMGKIDLPPHMDEIRRDLDLTIAGWRRCAQNLALCGFEDEAVIRSALCLKLHQYNQTGAIIAAATTSIPESPNDPRTWDYRFCWLRDSVFTVEALRRLAQFQEGRDFIMFLRDAAESGPLQPLYGIGCERELPEVELEHLAGFRGSKPVRVGNAAAGQNQSDLMGEVILCLRTLLTDPRVDFHSPHDWLPLVERLVDRARRAVGEPDMGIWEYRTVLQTHVFSQAMCWAAFSNGAVIAKKLGRPDLAATWEQEADALRVTILERGFNAEVGMFTQAYENDKADASNLLLPLIGMISPRDPRFLSTLDKYEKLLLHNGHMMRYVHEDDFGQPRSSFTICSFWWAEALALAGRLDEGIEMFHRVLAHANPLGLLSEDIVPETGELLGNFPQAYTHVGLVNAATTIGTLLRAKEGRFQPWS